MNSDAAVAVIQFVLANKQEDPMSFLQLWSDGEFDKIRQHWKNVPDDVFIGADPLFNAPKQITTFDLEQLPNINVPLHPGYEFSAYGINVITHHRDSRDTERCHGCVFNYPCGSCVDIQKDMIKCGPTNYIFKVV